MGRRSRLSGKEKRQRGWNFDFMIPASWGLGRQHVKLEAGLEVYIMNK